MASNLGCTKILWDNELENDSDELSGLVQDKSWAESFETRASEVDFKFIGGTRESFLSAETHVEAKKTSQIALKKNHSKVYPVGQHFVFVSGVDNNKSYYPSSEVVMDVPTAFALFAKNRSKTTTKLMSKATKLCSLWNKEFFNGPGKTQKASERRHMGHFIKLSSHLFTTSANVGGGGGWRQTKNVRETHTSSLILCLTNYWWIRKNQLVDKKIECKPKDLHVTLKLASTTFKSANSTPAILESGEELFFDRSGLVVPFAAFYSLLYQQEFVEYVRKLHDRYQSEHPESGELNLLTEDRPALIKEKKSASSSASSSSSHLLTTDDEDDLDLIDLADKLERQVREKASAQRRRKRLNSTSVEVSRTNDNDDDDNSKDENQLVTLLNKFKQPKLPKRNLSAELEAEKCKGFDSLEVVEVIHLTQGEGPQTPPRSPSLLVSRMEIIEDPSKEDGEEEKGEPEELQSQEASATTIQEQ